MDERLVFNKNVRFASTRAPFLIPGAAKYNFTPPLGEPMDAQGSHLKHTFHTKQPFLQNRQEALDNLICTVFEIRRAPRCAKELLNGASRERHMAPKAAKEIEKVSK